MRFLSCLSPAGVGEDGTICHHAMHGRVNFLYSILLEIGTLKICGEIIQKFKKTKRQTNDEV